MNYANAGPLVDPAVLVPLVDPVTAGHISRCRHTLSHQWIQLQLVSLINTAAAGPLVDAYVSPIRL